MRVVRSVVRRTLLVPAVLPLLFVSLAGAWVAHQLARVGLGGSAGFVDEVRQGSLLFGGLLTLSLAEPLEVGREVRDGLLGLRVARGGGHALPARWLGLVLATVPVLAGVCLVSGGLPPRPLLLARELFCLAAVGLALGAWFDRARLVPALWVLLVAGYLRPWTEGTPLAWVLPALGTSTGEPTVDLAHAALWCGGALLLASWRLDRVVARGA